MRQWYSVCWCTTLKLGLWNKHRKTDYGYLKCPVWGELHQYTGLGIKRCVIGLVYSRTYKSHRPTATQYFGHVQRMDHTRYPKLALHGYVYGTRKQGRPKKRWIDMEKDDCKHVNSTFTKQQRWHNIIRHGGAWWSCLCAHPRRHGNKSSKGLTRYKNIQKHHVSTFLLRSAIAS